MVARFAHKEVFDALERQAAVALLGPRQVGKTTLAYWFVKERNALYLDLENSDDRRKLDNPSVFLGNYKDRLVILDEIHRMPNLFPILRGVIDQGRRQGLRNGRFLLLGSASLDLLKQAGESLAGRIRYVELPGFLINEIESSNEARQKLWVRGGFPDNYLANSDADSFLLRKDLLQTYLDRDARMFSPRIPAETLLRLWTMLAHNQSQLLNAAALGKSLQTSTQSVTRYLDLLVDLLLVRRLTPFAINTKKRLVKAPKVYIRDSGLLHALLNISDFSELCGHPVVGSSWEGFVVESLLGVSPHRTHAGFYRTSAGAEIDLILELPGGDKWAIEIKQNSAPKVSRGFYSAITDLQPQKAFVVHAGDEEYPITDEVTAIPLSKMIDNLLSLRR
ncbi:MAG: ATP-binding protein [Verrucomicrobia bacterium]|nr:ATP-binding protein [Verrucomicrobiota bacterium]